MSTHFVCPSCTIKLQVPTSVLAVGKVRCPKCGATASFQPVRRTPPASSTVGPHGRGALRPEDNLEEVRPPQAAPAPVRRSCLPLIIALVNGLLLGGCA